MRFHTITSQGVSTMLFCPENMREREALETIVRPGSKISGWAIREDVNKIKYLELAVEHCKLELPESKPKDEN